MQIFYCLWINIQQIQNISCVGECYSSLTKDPTVSPTSAPTATSLKPTVDPTTSPTIEPTSDPTHDPTDDPTTNPTMVPTVDPTEDPTVSPTRKPTRDNAYDSHIEITYSLKDLLPTLTQFIADNLEDEMNNIRLIIEEGYVTHLSSKPVTWALQFYEFWVQILNINSRTIQSIDNDENVLRTIDGFVKSGGLMLESRISCSEAVCDDIINGYDKELFENVTNELLNVHYEQVVDIGVDAESASRALVFSVESDALFGETSNTEDQEKKSVIDYICIL